jgi:hypothetical protein
LPAHCAKEELMPIKITNKWNNRFSDVVNYKVQLSGAAPDEDVLDVGSIALDETREVPDEKLNGKVFKLTMTLGSDKNLGHLFAQGLSKDSEVTAIVTKPFQSSGTE